MSERDNASKDQLNELRKIGVGGLVPDKDEDVGYNHEILTRRHGGYGGGGSAFGENGSVRRETMEQNNFWGTVNLAELVELPKPHLTQPDVVRLIEEGMTSLDDAGRVSAFRQVMVGVLEGKFSQYALLPFGHNAWTEHRDDAGKDNPRRFNRMGEAIRMLTVFDGIVAEMPKDAEPQKRHVAYGQVVEDLRDENGINDDRLVELILSAKEAKEPFWVDSRDFLVDGEILNAKITLDDLKQAGLITIQETERGGFKVFVVSGEREKLTTAIDALADAGFTACAEVIRKRTKERPRNLGSSLRALANTSSSSSEDEGDEKEESA